MSEHTDSVSKFGYNNIPEHSKDLVPSARAVTASERKRGQNLRKIEDLLNQRALDKELDL